MFDINILRSIQFFRVCLLVTPLHVHRSKSIIFVRIDAIVTFVKGKQSFG